MVHWTAYQDQGIACRSEHRLGLPWQGAHPGWKDHLRAPLTTPRPGPLPSSPLQACQDSSKAVELWRIRTWLWVPRAPEKPGAECSGVGEDWWLWEDLALGNLGIPGGWWPLAVEGGGVSEEPQWQWLTCFGPVLCTGRRVRVAVVVGGGEWCWKEGLKQEGPGDQVSGIGVRS